MMKMTILLMAIIMVTMFEAMGNFPIAINSSSSPRKFVINLEYEFEIAVCVYIPCTRLASSTYFS